MSRFDSVGLLRSLREHDVAFIVIGGIAASTHGSPSLTRDLDICYERSRENYEALARALQSLRARTRGFSPDLPFKVEPTTLLLDDHFMFSTDLCDLDCLGTPAGTDGYADLVPDAVEVEIGGMIVKVAALDDLMRMKRAAGRPKDLVELEILGALRDEIDRREDE